MAELKTTPSNMNIDDFLAQIDEKRLPDTKELIKMMSEITNKEPVIWGKDIIGFGNVHLTYASGRELDYFLIGFAVRKTSFTIYLSIEVNKKVFIDLGKHTKGVGCLFIKELSDVHIEELKRILYESVSSIQLS